MLMGGKILVAKFQWHYLIWTKGATKVKSKQRSAQHQSFVKKLIVPWRGDTDCKKIIFRVCDLNQILSYIFNIVLR